MFIASLCKRATPCSFRAAASTPSAAAISLSKCSRTAIRPIASSTGIEKERMESPARCMLSNHCAALISTIATGTHHRPTGITR